MPAIRHVASFAHPERILDRIRRRKASRARELEMRPIDPESFKLFQAGGLDIVRESIARRTKRAKRGKA